MLINKINKFFKSKLYCKCCALFFIIIILLVKELLFANTGSSIEPYNQMKKGKNNKKKTEEYTGELNKKETMSLCRETDDIDVILGYTHSKDNDIRLEAVKQLCPCKVQKDIDVFWERVFELVPDEDARIRKRVLHIICDGSPERLEDKIY
jgi:hypothetical protein